MKYLNIIKTGINTFTFTANSVIEITMRKTATGWNIEATKIADNDTTFLWVAHNAREAVKDCYQTLRFVERRHAIGVRKWN